MLICVSLYGDKINRSLKIDITLKSQEQPLLVIAHRGAMLKAPENSLEAFQVAFDEGAHRIELDLQLSKDGITYVCHDDNTGRVTGEARQISQSLSEDLDDLRLANVEKLPRLSEVLGWWQEHHYQLSLNLELKSENPELVSSLIADLDSINWVSSPNSPDNSFSSPHQIVLSSRSLVVHKSLYESLLRPLPRAYIWEKTPSLLPWNKLAAIMENWGITIIHPKASDWSAELQKKARKKGFFIYSWSAQEENELMDSCAIWTHLAGWRVDGHCTNAPLEFGQFLRKI